MATTINFYDYAFNAISESIKTMATDTEDIVLYYGDEDECTIEDYFRSQSDGENIYDSVDERSEDTLIGSIEELKDDFESARYDAFAEWLVNELEDIDEDEILEDVSDRVVVTPNYETNEYEDENGELKFDEFIHSYDITFNDTDPDMRDEEMNTSGTALFERLFSLAIDLGGYSIYKIAALAGAQYYYVHRVNDGYSVYFWL